MDRDSNKYIVHFLCVKLVSVGLGDQKLGGVGVLRLYVVCISILSRGFISVWSESGRVALRRGNVDERRTRVPEVSGSSLSNATYWIWSTVIRVTNPQPRPVHGQLGFLTVLNNSFFICHFVSKYVSHVHVWTSWLELPSVTLLTLSLLGVINVKIPLQPHKKYDITQYREFDFS